MSIEPSCDPYFMYCNLNWVQFCPCIELQLSTPGSNQSIGVGVLKAYGQHTGENWYWIGVGALIGFYVIFNLGFTISLGYMPSKGFVLNQYILLYMNC